MLFSQIIGFSILITVLYHARVRLSINVPIHALALRGKESIRFGEMLASEEPGKSGKRARMRRLEYEMPRSIDQVLFTAGVGAPKQKYHRLLARRQDRDHVIGKGFPASPPVG